MWRWCCEVFDYLALGAIVDGRVFCVHGGLSPNLQGIDQVCRLWMGLGLNTELVYRYEGSTGNKKSRTMVQCVIFCGRILTVCYTNTTSSFR